MVVENDRYDQKRNHLATMHNDKTYFDDGDVQQESTSFLTGTG